MHLTYGHGLSCWQLQDADHAFVSGRYFLANIVGTASAASALRSKVDRGGDRNHDSGMIVISDSTSRNGDHDAPDCFPQEKSGAGRRTRRAVSPKQLTGETGCQPGLQKPADV